MTQRELNDTIYDTPGVVAVLSDSSLCETIKSPIKDPPFIGHVVGELLFRWWLYAGERSEELKVALELARKCLSLSMEHLPCRGIWGVAKAPSRVDRISGCSLLAETAWGWCGERCKTFQTCDGIVPVVTSDKAAVPIAFKLLTHHANAFCHDQNGAVIKSWERQLGFLPALVEEGVGGRAVQFYVDMHLPGLRISGSSFALPVLLAVWREAGLLPQFGALDVLATGAFNGGVLGAVSGLAAKRALAQRIGVRFGVGPEAVGSGPLSNWLPLARGMDSRDCRELIRAELYRYGLSALDAGACQRELHALERSMHDGALTPAEVSRRLVVVRDAVQTMGGLSGPDLRLRAIMAEAALANHSGDPIRGSRLAAKAGRQARASHYDHAHAESMARLVVSLTDRGMLMEARRSGHRLVDFASTMHGSGEERNHALMIAHGVLGGQPLYQLALQDPKFAEDSRRHLDQAVLLAGELSRNHPEKHQSDYRRDIVYLAQLKMSVLNEPIDKVFAEAETVLGSYGEGRGQNATDHAYLRRHRWFGAYRQWVHYGKLPSGWQGWPLPEGEHAAWLRATALKYRGAFYAEAGNYDAACIDFDGSVDCLLNQESALLRFIGATAATQAARSCKKCKLPLSQKYAIRAQRVFEKTGDIVKGACCGKRWTTERGAAQAQRIFAY